MFILISILAVATWTGFALISNGKRGEEIKSTVTKLGTQSLEALRTFGSLLKILIVDLVDSLSGLIENKPVKNQTIDIEHLENKEDLAEDQSIECEETEVDNAIEGLSPEVIQLIDEEESKAA